MLYYVFGVLLVVVVLCWVVCGDVGLFVGVGYFYWCLVGGYVVVVLIGLWFCGYWWFYVVLGYCFGLCDCYGLVWVDMYWGVVVVECGYGLLGGWYCVVDWCVEWLFGVVCGGFCVDGFWW